MRKILSISLIVVLALASFVGCGGGAAETDGSGDGTTAEPITIQLPIVDPADSVLGVACYKFKEYVEAESDGMIKVNVLPNGEFGGDMQAMEGVAIGTIPMAVTISSVLTTYNNDFMILDMPFIFNSKEASYAALDGSLGERLNEVLPEYGLIGFGYNDNGFRHITNSKRPITEPNDMKGIKIRVMESPVYMTMFSLMGANPTPMSFSEVYTALQQGTIDAQENGPVLVYTTKFHEVQDYYSLTGHVASINSIIANKKWFDGLTPEQQKIITDGVQQELITNERISANELEVEYLQKLKDEGMQVNEITPENQQKFKDVLAPMYEEYMQKFDPALFDLVQEGNDAVK